MTDVNLDFIRANLEHGEIKKLAEENGMSYSNARRILQGRAKRYHRFLGICFNKAIERASMIKSLNEKTQSL